VFRYAKGLGATSSNPAADITIAMKRVPKSRSRPAFVTLPEAREMLRTVEHAGASPITKAPSRLLALTAQRPGMIRRLRWSQISGIDWQSPENDISQALWTVPAEEMRQELELRENEAFRHMIPLAPQAVDLLRVIRRLTCNSE
jgi:integrase